MKKYLLMALVAFLWSAHLSAAGNRYALGVDGLACPFCAYGLEKKLSAIEGVQRIETDVRHGRVIVTLSQDRSLTEDAARRAVKAAGFTLRSFAPRDTDE